MREKQELESKPTPCIIIETKIIRTLPLLEPAMQKLEEIADTIPTAKALELMQSVEIVSTWLSTYSEICMNNSIETFKPNYIGMKDLLERITNLREKYTQINSYDI